MVAAAVAGAGTDRMWRLDVPAAAALISVMASRSMTVVAAAVAAKRASGGDGTDCCNCSVSCGQQATQSASTWGCHQSWGWRAILTRSVLLVWQLPVLAGGRRCMHRTLRMYSNLRPSQEQWSPTVNCSGYCVIQHSSTRGQSDSGALRDRPWGRGSKGPRVCLH